MLLTIVAINGDVAMTDPFPTEGLLAIAVKAGTTGTFLVSPSQLDRIVSQLADLETRVDSASQGPIMTWTVTDDTTQDRRGLASSDIGGFRVKSISPGALSVGTPVAVTVKGTSFFEKQTKAVKAIGDSSVMVTYTATVPGSAGNAITIRYVKAGLTTSLSVSVTGSAITVNLATDGAGVVTSTATLVTAAVAASAAAAALVTPVATHTGTIPNASVAAVYLAGGTGPGITVSVNGAAQTLLTTSDTQLTFLPVVGNYTGVAAADDTMIEIVAGSKSVVMSIDAVA